MNVLILIITTIGKNLAGMFLGKRMLFWALETATRQTDNAIDDNVVALAKAAYENDPDGVRTSAERLLAAYKTEKSANDE